VEVELRPQRVPGKPPSRREVREPLELRLEFEDGAPVASAAGSAAWIDALAPRGVRVAFVPGADGSVGRALEALGVACRTLAPEELEGEALAQFTTILLDVRTFGSSAPLRNLSPRLRDWIAAGGHLVALYHKTPEWNPFAKEGRTPSPVRLELTDRRVCEEDAPVRILRPADPLLLEPNVILARDFDGWVQERALYVPHESYDPAFDELLSCADRGEEPLRGTLLSWRSPGGGSFTWCALALHRQLRAGHAGAYRLLANLVDWPSPPRR
jgi:hypothetical protein